MKHDVTHLSDPRKFSLLFFFVANVLWLRGQDAPQLFSPADGPTLTIPTAPPQIGEPSPTQLPEEPQPAPTATPPQETKIAGGENIELSEEQIGIQGNWVKKLGYVKDSRESLNSVNTIYKNAQEFQKTFYDSFRPIDKELNDFYNTEIGQVEVDTLLKDLAQDVETNKSEGQRLFNQEIGKLSDKDREARKKLEEQYLSAQALEEDFNETQAKLKQFEADMRAVEELKKGISDRLKKFEEQLGVINQETNRAEEITRSIFYMIDDKKAAKACNDLKGILEKVKALEQYLRNDLFSNLEATIKTTREEIATTTKLIADLEIKGLKIHNRTAFLAQEQERQKELMKKREEEEKKKQLQATQAHWYDPILSVCSTIKLVFVSIYESIFGSQQSSTTPPKSNVAVKKEK